MSRWPPPNPGERYRDGDGRLWRVESVWRRDAGSGAPVHVVVHSDGDRESLEAHDFYRRFQEEAE